MSILCPTNRKVSFTLALQIILMLGLKNIKTRFFEIPSQQNTIAINWFILKNSKRGLELPNGKTNEKVESGMESEIN